MQNFYVLEYDDGCNEIELAFRQDGTPPLDTIAVL